MSKSKYAVKFKAKVWKNIFILGLTDEYKTLK